MTDKTKLPKVVKTRETIKAFENHDRSGECHPMNTGRHGVFVETSEDWPEPGSEMLRHGSRVTVDGTPTPTGRVWIYSKGIGHLTVLPSSLTPIPQTQTITFEIPADEDPKYIGLHRRARYPSEKISVEARLVAIDGEEVDDE